MCGGRGTATGDVGFATSWRCRACFHLQTFPRANPLLREAELDAALPRELPGSCSGTVAVLVGRAVCPRPHERLWNFIRWGEAPGWIEDACRAAYRCFLILAGSLADRRRLESLVPMAPV